MTEPTASLTQHEYWNSEAAARWVRTQPMMDALLDAHGERALAAAHLWPGDAVLDVGCGCGATTLAAAARVGPRGLAVGIDISGAMLGHARTRAAALGLCNVHFEHGDVQSYPLPEERFDAALSRFGIMFFTDPGLAFSRILRALRRGGRFAAVAWRKPEDNPWITVPVAAVAPVLETKPIDLDEAGPFFLWSRGRIVSLLEAAEFRPVEVTPVDLALTFRGAPMDAARLMSQLGPVGRAATQASDEVRARVFTLLAEALGPYYTGRDVVMSSGAWLITARRAS